MFCDYECKECSTVSMLRKTTPIGESFESEIIVLCETCNKETNHKRIYSSPTLCKSGEWDSKLKHYTPSPLTPMNKIEHFNKGLGRTAGVETAYDIK